MRNIFSPVCMLLVQLAAMNVFISFLSAAQFARIQFLGINSSIHNFLIFQFINRIDSIVVSTLGSQSRYACSTSVCGESHCLDQVTTFPVRCFCAPALCGLVAIARLLYICLSITPYPLIHVHNPQWKLHINKHYPQHCNSHHSGDR